MIPRVVFILVVLLGFTACSAWAHGEKHDADKPSFGAVETEATGPGASDEKARQYFTDLPVVTQGGKKLRFYSDVLKDRVVLISLFYTHCTQACPLTIDKLAQVQEILNDELGRDIFLISISLDPKNDTPAVLKDYASKFSAGKGWLFLTGAEADLKEIAYRLGHRSPRVESHNTQFMIGNVKAEHWTKVRPDTPAEIIAARLRLMASSTAAK